METAINALQDLPLFRGMSPDGIRKAVETMQGVLSREEKGAVLTRQGDPVTRWGVLLSGKLQGQRVDEDGVLTVISTLQRGMTFGEILMFSPIPAPVTLTAVSDCTVVYFHPLDPAQTDPVLMRNLLELISAQYWALHEKIRYCSIVRLRRRIWVYLCDRQPAPGVPFTIPFDRGGLAAYLNADRSALSRELSRMKNDGLLEYHKNRFRLLKPR